MSFPLRSPRDQVGITVFGRILDKIRLQAWEGKLPDGYHLDIIPGSRTFDDRICKLLNIDFAALSARTLQGGTDEEILEWCFQQGRKPDPEHVEISTASCSSVAGATWLQRAWKSRRRKLGSVIATIL